jgi:DNA-directed RNA polymerase subunit RPC12/RpoP
VKTVDRQESLHGGLAPVDCARCGVRVLVKKHSLQHTSVQWSASAVTSCPDLRGGATTPTCLALRDSIDHAVKVGRLAVLDG